MSERTSAPGASSTTADAPSRLMTEAEALCSAMLDMGMSLAVNLSDDRLFVGLNVSAKPEFGALALLKLVDDRMMDDAMFREEVISAVSSLGAYLSDAPTIRADLKTAPATDVIQALATAGLLIRHHYEAGDGRTPMLSFMPVPGTIVHPNAHMLMKLAGDRFTDEPSFARDVTEYVVAAGRSQHNA